MAQTRNAFLLVACVLLTLVGLAAGAAALALFFAPDSPSGIGAGRSAVLIVATGAFGVGVALVTAGVMTAARRPSAWPLAIAAEVAFVGWGLIGNYVLFAEPRLVHSATNALLAALTIWLLTKARSAPGRAQVAPTK